MGGFKEPEITLKDSPVYIILGKRYKGNVEDKKLKQTYKDAQNKYKEEILKGTFCVIHFLEPDENKGGVDAVVGVIVKDTTVPRPKTYSFYVIEKREVVQATLKSHYSVAPSPETVNSLMKEMANKNGYKLGKGSLEKYYDAHNWIVEVPVIKK